MEESENGDVDAEERYADTEIGEHIQIVFQLKVIASRRLISFPHT